ncbi:hypothetical protein S40285_10114 [Stachybotrys chlorohalonatus IBT 40285]|uniref:Expansin-like EG45 domain-containing protein n=1 Tax=Stachybotrys chlorohalonatus (strain IBT 40285) TaxID=1283841 RepID=A0A084QVN1_STAC4|nr:hypothetical protein S40285_10114 [Stachybotrys chlorohalonata IBT 40285]
MDRDELDTSKEVHASAADLDSSKEVYTHATDPDSNKEVDAYPMQYMGDKVYDDQSSTRIPHDGPRAAPELAPVSEIELLVSPSSKNPSHSFSKPLPDRPPSASRRTWRNPSRRVVVIIVTVAVVAIVAIIAGAVIGTHNASDRGAEPSSSAVAVPTEDDVAVGSTFTASFTYYGSGDSGEGESCLNYGSACGFLADPGFTVQVSENLYGQGITCGTCWRLDPTHSDENQPMNSSIVAVINEMCPALGYPICGQRDLDSVNSQNAQVNFNLCVDTGAWDAFAGRNSGIGLALGTVTRVDCDEWEGEMQERG